MSPDSSEPVRVAVVACDVIEDELRAVAADCERDLELRFLDIRYHSDYDGMERAIRDTIARAREAGADRVLVGYGSACHPEMEAIVRDAGAELLPAVNCLHMLAGRETHAEVFREDLLFASPGWLTKLVASARAAPERFADLERIVFVDPAGVDVAANEDDGQTVEGRLAELSELTGLPVERREIEDPPLAELVAQALEDEATASG